jgi:NAD(P)-dependent dehydrogenase (short-subunit alcohol dehydrogenase family)
MTGRNILVTGASSGIGKEVAILLSKLGARVILVARRESELRKTQTLLIGTQHLIETQDLTVFNDLSLWMKNISQKAGALHGLVHSAGIQKTQPVQFVKRGDIEETFSINVNAAIALAQAFRQKGVYQKNSSLVFLSSVLGMVGDAGVSVYSASKGAIIALTKSLAIEFSRYKIRVNCISPALVQTEMLDELDTILTEEQKNKNVSAMPLGQGKAIDVAYAVAFLLADTSRWITGINLVVDGGYTAR